jgi:hypothetical protein
VINCPLCREKFVAKFTVYPEYKTDYLQVREGMKMILLSFITLYNEYINIVEEKGDQIVLKEEFLKEHKFVFWNKIL